MAHGTMYESTIEHADGRKYLLYYISRPTGSCLIRTVKRYWDDIRDFTVCAEWKITKRGNRAELRAAGGDWAIRISGRTKHEAEWSKELPFWRTAK